MSIKQSAMNQLVQKGASAIDLFAGAGGATTGLRLENLRVLAAVEDDVIAAATFAENHRNTKLYRRDIRSLNPERIRHEVGLAVGELTLLKACPPCQGFSSLTRSNRSRDNSLILEVMRFARILLPKIILLENVPGLVRDTNFLSFVAGIERDGYSVFHKVVNASDFGVPQRRKRLILAAVRGENASEVIANFSDALSNYRVCGSSAFQAITDVKYSEGDPLHIPRRLDSLMLARLEAIPIDGSRFDLPRGLQLSCHTKLTKRTATSSYGRVPTTGPCATITTRGSSPSCGQFVHPLLPRPLTLRELALLQTFPIKYKFFGTSGQVARQIGNAVPVAMVRHIVAKLRDCVA